MSRRRRARSARNSLLWGLASFALLQLGLAAAVEGWLPDLRDPYYACRAARLARRVAGPDRPLTVVMLGSSRVQDGFQSRALEDWLSRRLGRPTVVFNFGIPGAGPVANWLHLERLRAAGVRPDLLFVEVLPVCLAGHAPEPPEADFLRGNRLWLGEVGRLRPYHFGTDARYRDWWLSFLVPVSGHRFAILSRLAPVLLPGHLRLDWARRVDDSGWQEPLVHTVPAEVRLRGVERDRQGHGPVLGAFRLGEPSARAVRDLLARCRDEGIPTALVWMPEASTYRSWLAPAGLAQLRAFLDEVRREYGAPLVDAREWVDDAGFRDGQHLARRGASAFSERFGREVLLPALSEREEP